MNELTKVFLENEMDLILAHKQSMRLAELTGLSLAAQTTLATAVSEVCRSMMMKNSMACLTLSVSDKKDVQKFIIAVLEDQMPDADIRANEGYTYAKRLVTNINSTVTDKGTRIELNYRLPPATRIDEELLEKWYIILNQDPAISPYEEIKRKNRQLADMAARLQESEQQYRSLTNSLPLMIYTTDGNGRITYANQWFYSYSGLSLDEINTDGWQMLVHPEDYAPELLQTKNGTSATMMIPEQRLKDFRNGEYRWHTGIATGIVDENGAVRCWNTFMVDIHARKLVEQALKDNVHLKEIQAELEDKVSQLNESNRQLEQFAYVASHDLQEPLRKITFYSDYLANRYQENLPDEARLFFNNLIKASARMKALVQDILAYSTVRNSRFEMVDLNLVAEEVLQDCEIAIREKQAEVTLEGLGTVEGNPRQLRQLFENLLSNALKFHQTGKAPVISITGKTENDQVVISFLDQGIGFEEQYLSKMFDLFQRLNPRDKYEGTGIGLAICRRVAEVHRGQITAVGMPGRGAEFIVTLPLKQTKKETLIYE